MPTKYLRKLFLEVTPEKLAVSKQTLFEQKHNITEQINAREVKRLERLNRQTSKADLYFNNHFEIGPIDERSEDEKIVCNFSPAIYKDDVVKKTFIIEYGTSYPTDNMIQNIYVNELFCKEDRVVMDETKTVKKGNSILVPLNVHSNRSFKLQNLVETLNLSLESNTDGIQLIYSNHSSINIQIEKGTELCIFITDGKHEITATNEEFSFFKKDIQNITEEQDQKLFHRMRDLVEHVFNHNMQVTFDNSSNFKESWKHFQNIDEFCLKI